MLQKFNLESLKIPSFEEKFLGIFAVEINEEKINAINARDLWSVLNVDRKFADWIKYQIESLDLEENLDYLVFHKNVKNPKGGRPQIEYILTLDAAKHIAMASKTKKGKEVRKYFIKVEKVFRNLLEKQIKEQLEKECEMKMKQNMKYITTNTPMNRRLRHKELQELVEQGVLRARKVPCTKWIYEVTDYGSELGYYKDDNGVIRKELK